VTSRTRNALIARGIDSSLAHRLVLNDYSLNRLSKLSHQQLLKLGLNQDQATTLLDSRRPPIDRLTVFELLHKCRRTCCICRKANQPFIIHHIVPWSESHSHDFENLVVLCLHCHSEAHTKRALAQNLTPDQIRYHKSEWQNTVRLADVESVIAPRDNDMMGAMWDYFNRSRLLHIASNLQLNLSEIPGHNCLVAAQHVLKGKAITDQSGDQYGYSHSSHVYEEIGEPLAHGVYTFYRNLFYVLIRRVPVTVITGLWSRTAVHSLVSAGTILAYTGAFRFKRQNRSLVGPGQMRLGYVRKRGIELRFTIDAWEATSSSALHGHLTRVWICTGVLLVRSVTKRDHLLLIDATCLSIGTGFEGHQDNTPTIALARMQDEDEYGEDEYENAEE
jgi:hypothetical protein